MDDVVHNTIPAELWIGQYDGELQACNTANNCTNHGDRGFYVKDMAVFSGRLWLAENSHLETCDSSGACLDYGNIDPAYLLYLRSLAVYDDRLWVGTSSGLLYSCDPSGNCTNHGNKTGQIHSMAVFGGRLWLGLSTGDLKSCGPTGDCINHGHKCSEILAMAVYDNRLWIGDDVGNLLSCRPDGTCSGHGAVTMGTYAMAVFGGRLWLGDDGGNLVACDEDGNCDEYLDRAGAILSMAAFNSRLYVGDDDGFLRWCDTEGNCFDAWDWGGSILSMAVFNPSGLGTAVYVKSGDVGIGTPNPQAKFHVWGGDGVVNAGYSWTTTSDKRLKKDISNLDNSLEKICRLRGVRFNLNDPAEGESGKGAHIGLVAQELEAEYPELVSESRTTGLKAVSYDKLTVILLEAVKELKARSEKQEQIIRDLEVKIFRMEQRPPY